MRKEFFVEGKQFKRLIDKLKNSDFSEWYETIEYMKENNQELFKHENTTCWFYQDCGLYQICIVCL